MKVIDLLNKIANNEEMPDKIHIKDYRYNYYWDNRINNYVEDNCKEDVWGELDWGYIVVSKSLNDEVEILDKENK